MMLGTRFMLRAMSLCCQGFNRILYDIFGQLAKEPLGGNPSAARTTMSYRASHTAWSLGGMGLERSETTVPGFFEKCFAVSRFYQGLARVLPLYIAQLRTGQQLSYLCEHLFVESSVVSHVPDGVVNVAVDQHGGGLDQAGGLLGEDGKVIAGVDLCPHQHVIAYATDADTKSRVSNVRRVAGIGIGGRSWFVEICCGQDG